MSRIRALETLSDAGLELDGLDLQGTNLELLQIPNARLRRVNLSGTVLADADLKVC